MDYDFLGIEFFSIIATTKELIERERKRLMLSPPMPRNFEDGPFCPAAQHHICKKVWAEKWFLVLLRRVHSMTAPIPLTQVPDALGEIDHKGMRTECKNYVIDWLRDSCTHLNNEEQLIEEAIDKITHLVRRP